MDSVSLKTELILADLMEMVSVLLLYVPRQFNLKTYHHLTTSVRVWSRTKSCHSSQPSFTIALQFYCHVPVSLLSLEQ